MHRLMKCLTRQGFLTVEEGIELNDIDSSMAPLQSASCTYRIALGSRVGQKVLTLKTAELQDWDIPSDRWVSNSGFSLHANTYCAPTN